MPNPRRSNACVCTCVLTRIDHCLVILSCLPCTLFCSCLPGYAKFAHKFLTLFHRPSATYLHSFLTNYTLLFAWIERHDHSVHVFHLAGTAALHCGHTFVGANNLTRNEHLSAASHVVQIHTHVRFPQSKKMADL